MARNSLPSQQDAKLRLQDTEFALNKICVAQIDQVKSEGHKTIVDIHLYLLNPVVVLLIQYITMLKMKERKKTPNLYLSSKPILTEGKLLYAPKGNSTYHF